MENACELIFYCYCITNGRSSYTGIPRGALDGIYNNIFGIILLSYFVAVYRNAVCTSVGACRVRRRVTGSRLIFVNNNIIFFRRRFRLFIRSLFGHHKIIIDIICRVCARTATLVRFRRE